MMKYSVVQFESLVKFVWFCVTTKKMFNLSGSAGWHADPYLSVMTIIS